MILYEVKIGEEAGSSPSLGDRTRLKTNDGRPLILSGIPTFLGDSCNSVTGRGNVRGGTPIQQCFQAVSGPVLR